MKRIFSMLFVCVLGCSDTVPLSSSEPDMGTLSDSGNVEPTASCVSLERWERCSEDGCVEFTCRGDEVCEDGACIPWDTAELSVDFAVTVSGQDVSVVVNDEGFPRAHVDALRFDFGDGVAGWGETLTHTYRQPGVFPVELVVRMKGYHELRARKLVEVGTSSTHNPLFLTVNQIPKYLNGSEPAILDNGTPADPQDDVEQSFSYLVPSDRFDIDIAVYDTATDPIDRATLKLLTTVGDTQIDTTDAIEWSDDRISGRVRIREEEPMPSGELRLSLTGTTQGGVVFEQFLELSTTTVNSAQDPRNRPTVWLFRDDLDFFSTSRNQLSGKRYQLLSVSGADGENDFPQELRLMGAAGENSELNTRYYRWIRDAITTEVYRIFGISPDGTPRDEIALTIFWSNQDEAPEPSAFSTTGEFSMMRLGGVFDGYLGFSRYSDFNQERADDSTIDYGVASAGILNALTSNPGVTDGFAAINPDVGVVLGAHEHDARVLSDDFDVYAESDPEVIQRYRDLMFVARNIALALAPVIAHEMGHAMGLMPDGLPPEGFFGGRADVSFISARTNSHHADFPGLVLMQAGGDPIELFGELNASIERGFMTLIELAETLSLETRLSPLSRAYLQGKLSHTP